MRRVNTCIIQSGVCGQGPWQFTWLIRLKSTSLLLKIFSPLPEFLWECCWNLWRFLHPSTPIDKHSLNYCKIVVISDGKISRFTISSICKFWQLIFPLTRNKQDHKGILFQRAFHCALAFRQLPIQIYCRYLLLATIGCSLQRAINIHFISHISPWQANPLHINVALWRDFCFFTFLPLPAVNLHWLDSRGSHSAPETCLRLSPTLIGFAWTYTESGPQQNSEELARNFKVTKDFKQPVFLTFKGNEIFKAQIIVKNHGVHNNELDLVLLSHTTYCLQSPWSRNKIKWG